MSKFTKTVIIDTAFWYALYNPRAQYHPLAEKLAYILNTSTVLFPWSFLYETSNTRLAKRTIAVRHFEAVLRRAQVALLSDEPYREDALTLVLTTFARRGMALVDMVVRLILDDIKVRKHRILTFNQADFSDLRRKHNLEML